MSCLVFPYSVLPFPPAAQLNYKFSLSSSCSSSRFPFDLLSFIPDLFSPSRFLLHCNCKLAIHSIILMMSIFSSTHRSRDQTKRKIRKCRKNSCVWLEAWTTIVEEGRLKGKKEHEKTGCKKEDIRQKSKKTLKKRNKEKDFSMEEVSFVLHWIIPETNVIKCVFPSFMSHRTQERKIRPYSSVQFTSSTGRNIWMHSSSTFL